jgi:circadian clock protein KaiC
MTKVLSERSSTGVSELDAVLGGGLPRGSLVLLSGNAGSGKTILSTQFLHNGATKHGEKGIYVSFAENRADYFRNMLGLGMDMQRLEEKGLFKFMDFATMDETGMRKAVQMMIEEIDKLGAKRLVVDPISAILQTLGPAETRKLLHTLFGKAVKTMGVTTIIIGEIPFGESKSGFGVEEFIADGVIFLKSSEPGLTEKRTLNIAKIRGVALDRSAFEYLIDERHNGLSIIVLPAKPQIMVASKERLSSGVEGLDRMLHGDVYRDSITLVEGMAGIGKTTLCLHFMVAAAKKGERSLFISFEEPIGQIRRMLEGFGIDYKRLGDKFRIEAYVPEALTPLHYYKLLRDLFEEYKPNVLAMDTVTAMRHTLPEEDFISFMRYLQLLCKEKQLTVFLTSSMGTLVMTRTSEISTLADNIFLIRYRELENKTAREILVMKMRGSPHETQVMPFKITDKGIVLQAQS